ncbi:hypothetical protein Tco_1439871 [Tanacetum coccineum]
MYAEVILGTDDETSSKDDTSSNDEISSSEDLINYLSARDVEWQLHKNTQEEPPKLDYDPIKTEVEDCDLILCTHIHMLLQVLWVPIEQQVDETRLFVNRMREEAQTSRNMIGQLTALVADMEAFDDPGEVFDTLMGLRDDIPVEEAKLAGLNDLITQAEKEIEMKEAQLEVMGGHVNGSVHCVSSFTHDKDVFQQFLNHIISEIDEPKWALFYCKQKKSLEKGLKLLHTDNDVHSFIDAAVKNGSINLYVAHKKQNLGKYYYKNMEWEEDDAGLRCSSSTPFSIRVKTKISKRKKTSVIHDEGDDKKKSLVTGGRKGKEKVIEDEGICSKRNKADVSIYKRAMVNGKAKTVKDVGSVKRGKERGVVIEDGGFSNDGGKETVVTKRAIRSRKMEGKSVKVESE